MSVYLISDTHFGDEAIIRYEKWPFEDSNDYLDTFVHTWNQTIMPEDEIYHMGDVSSLGKEKTKDILDQLYGHKYLIMGNHDRHLSIMDWHDIGFEKVYDHPILIDGFVLLSHEPLYMILNMPYVNIFGMYMETLIIKMFLHVVIVHVENEITGHLNCMMPSVH